MTTAKDPSKDLKKVLVIDDSWVVLESVRAALVAAGYTVRVSSEPDAAAKMAAWADLVIVDFHMPGVDGATLLPTLRMHARDAAPRLYYLYTSDAEVARKYETFGFDGGFLRKGEEKALVPQVDAAFRTIKLRKLAHSLKERNSSIKPPRE